MFATGQKLAPTCLPDAESWSVETGKHFSSMGSTRRLRASDGLAVQFESVPAGDFAPRSHGGPDTVYQIAVAGRSAALIAFRLQATTGAASFCAAAHIAHHTFNDRT